MFTRRFGVVSAADNNSTSNAAKKELTEEDRQKLLKRKDRFGEVTSTLVNKVRTGHEAMYPNNVLTIPLKVDSNF